MMIVNCSIACAQQASAPLASFASFGSGPVPDMAARRHGMRKGLVSGSDLNSCASGLWCCLSSSSRERNKRRSGTSIKFPGGVERAFEGDFPRFGGENVKVSKAGRCPRPQALMSPARRRPGFGARAARGESLSLPGSGRRDQPHLAGWMTPVPAGRTRALLPRRRACGRQPQPARSTAFAVDCAAVSDDLAAALRVAAAVGEAKLVRTKLNPTRVNLCHQRRTVQASLSRSSSGSYPA